MKKFLAVAGIAFAILFATPQRNQAAEPADIILSEQTDSARHALEEQVRNLVVDEISSRNLSQPQPTVIGDLTGLAGASIGLFAVICPFVMVCVIIYIIATQETKRRRRKYEMVEKAIENNYTVPDYVFYTAPKEKSKKTSLNNAIILMAVGIGTTWFFFLNGNSEVGALTSMIFLMGLGKTIVYALEERKKKALPQNQKPQANDPTDVKQD